MLAFVSSGQSLLGDPFLLSFSPPCSSPSPVFLASSHCGGEDESVETFRPLRSSVSNSSLSGEEGDFGGDVSEETEKSLIERSLELERSEEVFFESEGEVEAEETHEVSALS